eukprot:795589-Rhodomonas_salina.1
MLSESPVANPVSVVELKCEVVSVSQIPTPGPSAEGIPQAPLQTGTVPSRSAQALPGSGP